MKLTDFNKMDFDRIQKVIPTINDLTVALLFKDGLTYNWKRQSYIGVENYSKQELCIDLIERQIIEIIDRNES